MAEAEVPAVGVGTTHSSPPTAGCRQVDEVIGLLSCELNEAMTLRCEDSELDKEASALLKLESRLDSEALIAEI
jgi:hypothetical protein